MYKKINIKQNQTPIDLALQYYGDASALPNMLNDLQIDYDSLKNANIININPKNNTISNFYKNNNIEIATNTNVLDVIPSALTMATVDGVNFFPDIRIMGVNIIKQNSPNFDLIYLTLQNNSLLQITGLTIDLLTGLTFGISGYSSSLITSYNVGTIESSQFKTYVIDSGLYFSQYYTFAIQLNPYLNPIVNQIVDNYDFINYIVINYKYGVV